MKAICKITASALALVMTLALVACGGNASSTASSAKASGELYGKPWTITNVQGNLPTEQPALKDDMYTHYNYEYLAAHQTKPSSTMADCATELQATNLTVIKDSSQSSHDLDQLRILFEQASDTEALQKTGLSEVQPYLDRIDAVKSIDEMNALLTAEDFPFSPFILSYITTTDTRDVNVVNVGANLSLVDTIAVGGTYYQDSDDPKVQESMLTALQNAASLALIDLMSSGMSKEEVSQAFNVVAEFEKKHGKYVEYNGMYTSKDFGAMAEAAKNSYFTLDELCAACPNFPLKATLDKMMKGNSPRYVSTPEWLKAFNDVWTAENLDAIKLVAKLKVLADTRPYRDPSTMNQILQSAGMAAATPESFAYEACNQQDTFAIVLGQTYVKNALGPNAKTRLTELSQRLVDTYKDLVGNTPWISEDSKQRIIEKLDHMTLNVLEPVGGYYDFSGIELTPTSQGGTLIGNYLKLKQYRWEQESKMIGQPVVAACPWFTIRCTEMNAFYDPTSNSINIYPGYVTSLVYTDDMSDIDLAARAGFTIGHEISHSLDYQGAQMDAYGTPNPVFIGNDVDKFVLKCTTLAAYYKGIEIMPGTNVNGEIIVTEAAADLCGMQAILELAGKNENTNYEDFFQKVSYGWAQVFSEGTLPNRLLDAHPLDILRINVNVQMFDPIYDKLGVKEGDTMYLAPNERINIWGPNA